MSNQPMAPTSEGATPSVEEQLARLKSDVDHLKAESKSWVKTWGVYLGMLGALVALPKGILDLTTQLFQRPNTSLAIRGLTIYHNPGLSSEIVKFSLLAMNAGNRDDVLLSDGAKLKVAKQEVELPESDFGLYDNGNKLGKSLRIPKDETRAYDVSITFNSKTRELVTTPGPHKLELQFSGVKNGPYLASFCFPLDSSEIHDLFESVDYTEKSPITQCTVSESR